jgi:hypothetical protein
VAVCGSADHYLEQKVTWWWRVAETRRPAAAEAPAPASAVPAGVAAAQPPAALSRSA